MIRSFFLILFCTSWILISNAQQFTLETALDAVVNETALSSTGRGREPEFNQSLASR